MRFLSLVAGMLLPLTAAAQENSFFNAKDLSGWKGLLEHWSVNAGSLIGTTKPKGIDFNTFLCSDKEYGDFELKFQVRLVGGVGNSGVQIRSKLEEDKKFVVAGPQCDIGQIYWGSLYGERFGGMMQAAPEELVKRNVKVQDFNDYYILCKGKHVTIQVNSVTMVDADFDKLPSRGIIAFQLHGGPAMEVQFKNFQFKELK